MICSLISRQTLFSVAIGLMLTVVSGQVFACDSDAECGAGGTCIKREKRARGVCYGGDLSEATVTAPSSKEEIPKPSSAPSQPPTNGDIGNTGSDAPIYGEEGYVEPSAKPRIIDRLDVEEASGGACVASSDCAGGQECIYRDPMLGHGLCEPPP